MGERPGSTDGTATSTPNAIDPVVLEADGSLYADQTERLGAALSFLPDGRLLVGAPSYPHNSDPGGSSDDAAWLASNLEGRVSDSALELQDPWSDSDIGQAKSVNQFGSGAAHVGDVTGDGVADVALCEQSQGAPAGVVWSVFAGPSFTSGFPVPRWMSWDLASACGDVDHNGASELCTATGVVFGPITDATGPGLWWTARYPRVTSGDLDGDGATELVVSDADTASVSVIRSFAAAGQVTLGSVAAVTWTGTGWATALAVGDLDGDGAQDLVVGWSLQAPIVSPSGFVDRGEGVVYVGLPPGGGDPSAAWATLRVQADALAVGDFDGDGSDDLAVGGRSEVTVWRGPIAPGVHGLDAPAARYRGLQHPTDAFGSALAAADRDGDGRSDLAIGAPLEGDGYFSWGRVWVLDGAGL